MNWTKAIVAALLGASVWLGTPATAWADTCWSGPVSHVSFGTVGPGGGTAVGSLSATCQKSWSASPRPTYFRVCMVIPGGSPVNTVNPRAMSNYASGRINYDLYSNPSHTQLIGPNLTGMVYTATATISQAGSVQQNIPMPVYAKVHPAQATAAGNYQSQNYANLYWVASTTSMPPVSACSGGSTLNGIYQSVTATWANSCAILAANDLSFGVRDNLLAPATSQTTVSITCPVGTAWQVGLSNGQHFSGTRRMRHATRAAWIGYQLFRNTARTQPWGNISGSTTQSGTGTGSAQQLTIFGSAPAQPGAAPGSYEDTVVVTLTY